MPSALVTKLRKQPEVRDAEALAAWIGRYKKLRQAGVSNKKAMKLAGKQGGMKEGGVKAKDRKTGGDKKDKATEDQEVKDRIWERKNPENFGKPYLDKRTQDALREDPEKIDKLIEQQQEKIRGLESGRRRNRSEAEKDRVRTEANETIRSLEAFRRSLKGGSEKEAEKPQVSGYSGLTGADRKILEQARQRKSIAESYIKTYEGLLVSGNEVGRARARDMLEELRKMFP